MNRSSRFLISLFKQYNVNLILFKSLRITSSRNKKVLVPAISIIKDESLNLLNNNIIIPSVESSKSQTGPSSSGSLLSKTWMWVPPNERTANNNDGDDSIVIKKK